MYEHSSGLFEFVYQDKPWSTGRTVNSTFQFYRSKIYTNTNIKLNTKISIQSLLTLDRSCTINSIQIFHTFRFSSNAAMASSEAYTAFLSGSSFSLATPRGTKTTSPAFPYPEIKRLIIILANYYYA